MNEMSKYNLAKTHQPQALQLPLIDWNDSSFLRTSGISYQNSYKKHQGNVNKHLKMTTIKKNPQIFQSSFYQPTAQAMYPDRQPQQFKEMIDMKSNFIYDKYQVLDLTYSLINSKISFTLLTVLFLIQIFVRYFSLVCLIYLTVETNYEEWQWIVMLLITAMTYFVCIVKISLKAPETKSEYILKQSYNSLQQNQNLQYFQVIDARRLIRSLLRAMIPPELSFLYIKTMRSVLKNLHIYLMINYIYNSIEAILYYPFFFAYTYIIVNDSSITSIDFGWVFFLSYATIILSETTFLALTVYLLIFGCKKKGYYSMKKKKQ